MKKCLCGIVNCFICVRLLNSDRIFKCIRWVKTGMSGREDSILCNGRGRERGGAQRVGLLRIEVVKEVEEGLNDRWLRNSAVFDDQLIHATSLKWKKTAFSMK